MNTTDGIVLVILVVLVFAALLMGVELRSKQIEEEPGTPIEGTKWTREKLARYQDLRLKHFTGEISTSEIEELEELEAELKAAQDHLLATDSFLNEEFCENPEGLARTKLVHPFPVQDLSKYEAYRDEMMQNRCEEPECDKFGERVVPLHECTFHGVSGWTEWKRQDDAEQESFQETVDTIFDRADRYSGMTPQELSEDFEKLEAEILKYSNMENRSVQDEEYLEYLESERMVHPSIF